jgi:hypothetical protein
MNVMIDLAAAHLNLDDISTALTRFQEIRPMALHLPSCHSLRLLIGLRASLIASGNSDSMEFSNVERKIYRDYPKKNATDCLSHSDKLELGFMMTLRHKYQDAVDLFQSIDEACSIRQTFWSPSKPLCDATVALLLECEGVLGNAHAVFYYSSRTPASGGKALGFVPYL